MLVVQNKWYEITAVHVFHDREKAQREMEEEAEEAREEAIRKGCNLIVSHHPLIFRKLKRIADENEVQKTVRLAIENHVAIVSMHTNLDAAIGGVNSKIAEKIGLQNTQFLGKQQNIDGVCAGEGVIGELSEELAADDLVIMLKKVFEVECVQANELLRRPIRKVALCGGAGSFLLDEAVKAGESVTIKFKYKSSVPAKTTTQCHSTPGGYITSTGIGVEEGSNVINFSTEEQTFKMKFVIPNDCAGKDMQTIAFNMAEIEQACDYTIWDVIWKLADDTESLIDQTGAKNFYVKAVGDGDPYIFGTDHDTAIDNVVAKKNNSTVKFNLAGQRVSNDYKGVVVDNSGKKYIAQ